MPEYELRFSQQAKEDLAKLEKAQASQIVKN